ncbi:hypothetical protein G6O67_004155 [Ophiocordyceps sinensis]|uniref:Uncharacterized protein n=1 Tax=Ophiocordyceps sinensis TaxID=72228 RepID=A0A8H4PMK9_9HYPO|nr:hypothetical protein G6O67_004155 [Ophiocordyceps sinensis]
MLLHGLVQQPRARGLGGPTPNMLEQHQRLPHVAQANRVSHGLQARREDGTHGRVRGAAANDGQRPAETGVDPGRGGKLAQERNGLGHGAPDEVRVGAAGAGPRRRPEYAPQVEQGGLLEDEAGELAIGARVGRREEGEHLRLQEAKRHDVVGRRRPGRRIDGRQHRLAELEDLGDEHEQLEPAAAELAHVLVRHEGPRRALDAGAQQRLAVAVGVRRDDARRRRVHVVLDEEVAEVRPGAVEQPREQQAGGAEVVEDGAADIATRNLVPSTVSIGSREMASGGPLRKGFRGHPARRGASDLGEAHDEASHRQRQRALVLAQEVLAHDFRKHAEGLGVVLLRNVAAVRQAGRRLAVGRALGEDELQDQRVGKGERHELDDKGVHVGRAVAHAVCRPREIVAQQLIRAVPARRQQCHGRVHARDGPQAVAGLPAEGADLSVRELVRRLIVELERTRVVGARRGRASVFQKGQRRRGAQALVAHVDDGLGPEVRRQRAVKASGRRVGARRRFRCRLRGLELRRRVVMAGDPGHCDDYPRRLVQPRTPGLGPGRIGRRGRGGRGPAAALLGRGR